MFLRLYYPCQASENPQLPDWVPCREYFNGLADFMKINRALSERIFNYLFGKHFWLLSAELFENVTQPCHFLSIAVILRCGWNIGCHCCHAMDISVCLFALGSCKIPAAWNASFKPDGKYPVIIFSHGLGAFRCGWLEVTGVNVFSILDSVFYNATVFLCCIFRTLYSAICVELASQGFIVAAVEHRCLLSVGIY